MSPLTLSPVWQALKAHQKVMAGTAIAQLFSVDLQRFKNFSLELDGLLLDYSKNLINAETMRLLTALAQERDVAGHAERMFCGEKINTSEKRAVLHTALRGDQPVTVDGHDVLPAIREARERMRIFSADVQSGKISGSGGGKITDVVNLGIGGSHLGPALAVEALAPYADGPRVHFVSNIDPTALGRTLATLNPATTLFIVASKTFTTLETLANAETARTWAGDATRFVAVTEDTAKAAAWGIPPEHMFPLWDWVGGRYSLWSAVGLPVVLAIGIKHFEEMLAGAHTMDQHFRTTPLERNLPAILALLGIWYNDFFGAATQAILPYDESLALLPAYLQQLDMESSGKQITRDGKSVDYDTGMVIWGATGTNGQHAFFQLLHQGTRLIPADFIAACASHYEPQQHQDMLLANFLAQSAALMQGDGATFPGNRPSNAILFKKLTPRTFGMLLALYEHKVFVQNAIWDINAFDQPGVELGKKLAARILPALDNKQPASDLDGSTRGLIEFYKDNR
jgi:glucose-6-phosphate isomerase